MPLCRFSPEGSCKRTAYFGYRIDQVRRFCRQHQIPNQFDLTKTYCEVAYCNNPANWFSPQDFSPDEARATRCNTHRHPWHIMYKKYKREQIGNGRKVKHRKKDDIIKNMLDRMNMHDRLLEAGSEHSDLHPPVKQNQPFDLVVVEEKYNIEEKQSPVNDVLSFEPDIGYLEILDESFLPTDSLLSPIPGFPEFTLDSIYNL